MTIFTQARVRQTSFLEEYQAPLSDVLGVTAEESLLFSPMSSISRSRELARAEEGVSPNVLDYRIWGEQAPTTDSPMVDATVARQRVKDAGVQLTVPDNGIRDRALQILIERKHEEIRRESVLSRAPTGVLPTSLRIGTSLFSSALDPLNVASAFIPVLGEARYASMLERAGSAVGRAQVRAGIGAIEGAVGQAAVEPLVYTAAQREQADYGLSDSLLSIALGTALGGGLHVGAGVVRDIVRGAPRPAPGPLPALLDSFDHATKEALLRSSVSQAVTGREINVEPIVTYARGSERLGADLEQVGGGVAPVFEPTIKPNEVIGVDGITVYHGSPHTFDRFEFSDRTRGTGEGNASFGEGLYVAERRGIGEDYQKKLSAKKQAGVNDDMLQIGEQISDADYLLKSVEPGSAEAKELLTRIRGLEKQKRQLMTTASGALYEARIHASPGDFLDWDKSLSEQNAGVVEKLKVVMGKNWEEFQYADTRTAVKQGFIAFSDEGVRQKLMDAGIPGIKYLDAGSRAGGEGSRNYVVFNDKDITAVKRNDQSLLPQPEALRSPAAAAFAPEAYRLADHEAVRVSEEKLKAAPTDEAMPEMTMQTALEEVQALAAALGDPDIVAREMAPYEALSETAESYGRAVKTAAECGLRRGTA